jgi:hypothetical protein
VWGSTHAFEMQDVNSYMVDCRQHHCIQRHGGLHAGGTEHLYSSAFYGAKAPNRPFVTAAMQQMAFVCNARAACVVAVIELVLF